MMTERYAAWMAYFVMRDTALVNQATFAVSLVAAYLLRQALPPVWREPLRRLYLVGGIPLYVFTVSIGLFDLQVDPTLAGWLVLAVLPAALAFLIWQVLSQRRPEVTRGQL